MLGLCRALLRDPAEAEDAAQQAFLSAHRSLLNGADPREPAAWLATIARNECWARISAGMRRPLPTGDAETVAATDDPLAEAMRSADLAALWHAIRQLPRAQRDALLLREFGGLRYDELAVALAVTEPAVESLLVRARARLRAQLQTVYASLGPALRFLVGSGTPAIAAKAAALGLGAAAVTGGIAPQMLTRHHMQPPAARPRRAAVHHRAPARTHAVVTVAAIVAAAPPPAPAPVTTTVAPPRHQREHEDRAVVPRPQETQTVQSGDGSPASGSDDGGASDSTGNAGSGDGSGDVGDG